MGQSQSENGVGKTDDPTTLTHARQARRTPYLPVVEQKQDGFQNLNQDAAQKTEVRKEADQREDCMVSASPLMPIHTATLYAPTSAKRIVTHINSVGFAA